MGSIVVALDFSYVMPAFMGRIKRRERFVRRRLAARWLLHRERVDSSFPEISPLRILSTDRWVAEIQFRNAQH